MNVVFPNQEDPSGKVVMPKTAREKAMEGAGQGGMGAGIGDLIQAIQNKRQMAMQQQMMTSSMQGAQVLDPGVGMYPGAQMA